LFPANTWCFDLEIINAILDKGTTPEPGIRYCAGWGDHAGMGISVLVAARLAPDGAFMEARTFFGDMPEVPLAGEPLWKFMDIVKVADLLIGHNSRSFDAKVLAARGIHLDERKHLDFYHEVKKATRNNFVKGFKLDLLSRRCGGPGKTESGAQAPHMWQRGEHARVAEYCKNDILMTCAVASYYAKNGAKVPALESGEYVQLRHPQQIAEKG
jgi:hypothetical protein